MFVLRGGRRSWQQGRDLFDERERETKAKEEWMEGKGETEGRTDSGMLPKDQTGKAVG